MTTQKIEKDAKIPTKLLSVAEAADRLQLCADSVRSMMKKDILPYVQIGQRTLIRESDFEAFVNNLTNEKD